MFGLKEIGPGVRVQDLFRLLRFGYQRTHVAGPMSAFVTGSW